MTQGPTDSGKGNAGVSAGSLYNETARFQQASCVALVQDMVRHAVLDATGHVQVFSFSVDDPLFPIKHEFNCQQRCITDQTRQSLYLTLVVIFHH